LVKKLTFNSKVWPGIKIKQIQQQAAKQNKHPSFLIPGLADGRWTQKDFTELSQA